MSALSPSLNIGAIGGGGGPTYVYGIGHNLVSALPPPAPQHAPSHFLVSAPNPNFPVDKDEYEKVDTLGTGTFGRVWLTKSKHDSQYYALKICQKAEIVRLKQVDHMMNEKNILLALDHPFVVRL
jgi:serine/threonine protein kinase